MLGLAAIGVEDMASGSTLNVSDPMTGNNFSLPVDSPSSPDGSPAQVMPNEWTLSLIMEASVRVLFSLVTFLVNTLVLVTLATTPSVRESPAFLVIGSLAVTDLMVGVMGPAGLVIELQVVISPLFCRLGYATIMALCTVSINNLLFISVDRYLLISRPFDYVSLITKRRVIVFIALCWVYGSVLQVIFIATNYSRDDWRGECIAEKLFPGWLILFLSTVHFVLPFCVMMYVHVAIFIVARRQQRAVKLSFKRNGVEPGYENKKAKLRAARLLAIPCGYFHLCWGPWFVTILWAVLTRNTVSPQGLERFFQTLSVLNSLGNPILYALSQPVLGRAMLHKLKTFCSMCREKMASQQRKKLCLQESSTLVMPDHIENTAV